MSKSTISLDSYGSLITVIKGLLLSRKFELHNEKVLQQQMMDVLSPVFPKIQREHSLDEKNVIDFMLAGVGIEVKIKGGRKDIYRQCERYCAFDQVKVFVLVTNRSIGFPQSLKGKPCYVINLGMAWL